MSLVLKVALDGVTPGTFTTSTLGSSDTKTANAITGVAPQVVASGARSPRFNFTGLAGGQNSVEWTITPTTTVSGFFYFTTPSAWGSAATNIIQFKQATTTGVRLMIGGTSAPGTMRLANGTSTSALAVTASSTLSLSTLYRVHYQFNAATGVAAVQIYAGESTTAVATLSFTGTSADFGATGFANFRVGATVSTPVLPEMFYDDLYVYDDYAHHDSPYQDGADPVPLGIKQSDGTMAPLTLYIKQSDGSAAAASKVFVKQSDGSAVQVFP